MQAERERERVVAPDRDQRVDAQAVEHLEDVRRVVGRPLVVDRAQELGLLGGSHPRRVRPRGVQDRPAAPVDRADGGRVEVDDVRGHGRRVVGVASEEAGPAAADPRDLVALLGRAERGGLDARVQARDVAAAGQDADLHVRTPMRVVTRRAPVGSCLRSSPVVGLSRTWIVRTGQPTWLESEGTPDAETTPDLRGRARRLGGGLARERARPGAVRPRPSGSPAGPAADRPARAAPPDDRALRGPRTPRRATHGSRSSTPNTPSRTPSPPPKPPRPTWRPAFEPRTSSAPAGRSRRCSAPARSPTPRRSPSTPRGRSPCATTCCATRWSPRRSSWPSGPRRRPADPRSNPSSTCSAG